MKIAIVGGGITGVTLAWLLSGLGKVVVYEKTPRLTMKHGSIQGGVSMSSSINNPQSSKVDAKAPDPITEADGEVTPQTSSSDPINDSGIAKNPDLNIDPDIGRNIGNDIEKGVPLFFPYYQSDLAALFEYLDIYTEPCNLSYSSTGRFPFKMNLMPLHGLAFNNLSPLTNRRIGKDLLTLHKSLMQDYRQDNIPINLSLRQYIRGLKLHDNSISEVIYPTIAALWNYSAAAIQDLAASKYMEFVNKSKLLDTSVEDQVRYIPSGMDKYLRKILFKGGFEYYLNSPITKIKYANSTLNLTDANKSRKSFDRVIITTSPHEAKKIIDPELADWSEALSKLTSHSFPLYVHRDPKVLKDYPTTMGSSITYDLNIQNVGYHYNLGIINKLDTPAMLSINSPTKPNNIIYQASMNRPALDVVNTRYQREIKDVQGTAGVYYCTDGIDHGTSPMTGGIKSALMFAKVLGVDLPF